MLNEKEVTMIREARTKATIGDRVHLPHARGGGEPFAGAYAPVERKKWPITTKC